MARKAVEGEAWCAGFPQGTVKHYYIYIALYPMFFVVSATSLGYHEP